jgi:hypothetical protein
VVVVVVVVVVLVLTYLSNLNSLPSKYYFLPLLFHSDIY